LQSQGARAFHESSAVDILNLTADQTKKIRAIKNETMAKLWAEQDKAPGGFGGPKGMKIDKAQFEKITKAEMDKILATLTSQQRDQWNELIGPQFKGNVRRPPFHEGPGKGKKGPPDRKGPPPG